MHLSSPNLVENSLEMMVSRKNPFAHPHLGSSELVGGLMYVVGPSRELVRIQVLVRVYGLV